MDNFQQFSKTIQTPTEAYYSPSSLLPVYICIIYRKYTDVCIRKMCKMGKGCFGKKNINFIHVTQNIKCKIVNI